MRLNLPAAKTKQLATSTSAEPVSIGLAPIWRADAKVLILGSLPGVASLQAAQYYAHPRNQCWPILQHLFAIDASLPYLERIHCAQQQGIAFWDLVQSAKRRGSLDSAIINKSIASNRLLELLTELPKLQHIALNGQKAAELFDKQRASDLELQQWLLTHSLQCHRLPSTSPAHATLSLDEKLVYWRRALGETPAKCSVECSRGVENANKANG